MSLIESWGNSAPQIDILDDFLLQQIGQILIDQFDWHAVVTWVSVCRRVYHVCQPLIDQARKRWIQPPGRIRVNLESMEWYDDHYQLHRDADLPARMSIDQVEWYQHGLLHRDLDLPAIVHNDGTRRWYQNGELHRDGDQPAIIYYTGTQEWWIHGKRQREREGNQLVVVFGRGKSCPCHNFKRLHPLGFRLPEVPVISRLNPFHDPFIQKLIEHKKPYLVLADGTHVWWLSGMYNDRDLTQPAIVFGDGTCCWMNYCLVDREIEVDQPAVVSKTGTKIWYRGGHLIRIEEA